MVTNKPAWLTDPLMAALGLTARAACIVSGDTTKVVKDARPLDNCTIMSKPVNTERLLAAAGIATRTGEVPQD